MNQEAMSLSLWRLYKRILKLCSVRKKAKFFFDFCHLFLVDTCPFMEPFIPLLVPSPLVSEPEWAALFSLGRGVCNYSLILFIFAPTFARCE